jgi:hypothetical protein
MGVNECLIAASHNTKVKKIKKINCDTLIWFTLFLLGLCSTIIGVLRFSLGFRALHGPKNNKSNIVMRVLSLKIRLMEYVLSCLEGIAFTLCMHI